MPFIFSRLNTLNLVFGLNNTSSWGATEIFSRLTPFLDLILISVFPQNFLSKLLEELLKPLS